MHHSHPPDSTKTSRVYTLHSCPTFAPSLPPRRSLVCSLVTSLFFVTLGYSNTASPLPPSSPPPAFPTAVETGPPPVQDNVEVVGLATVPEWALATPAEATGSEIGIGSGPTLDQATRYAIQDVASRISVSIESQFTDIYSEKDGTAVESLERVIQTQVTETRFAGWQRTRSAERAGVFWAEVKIDQRRLVRDSMIELVQVANEVDLQLEGAQGSALRRLLAIKTTEPDRQRATALIALIDVLDPAFDRPAWGARRANWRKIDEAARRALVFEVRSDSASREIAHWVESRLVASRLRTRAGECVTRDAVCIDIRSEFTEADEASRHIAKFRATVAVLEPNGAVIQEGDLTGRGESKADAARARRNALDDLRQGLASFGFFEGLIQR